MWLGAKLTFKKLLYDDSGVAMAYTVLVSLFIFMLCVSTYAMTENIRQKMELQNACDAAAYSGAVVQADMLSRIAVLNRALSWTYAETNKRYMDWIISDWISNINTTYENYKEGMVFSGSGSNNYSYSTTCRRCGGSGRTGSGLSPRRCSRCGGSGTETQTKKYPWNLASYLGVKNCHICFGGDDHGQAPFLALQATYGWFMGWNARDHINLNARQDEIPLSTLVDERASVVGGGLKRQLDNGIANIGSINTAINTIRTNMNSTIQSNVESMLGANLLNLLPAASYTYCIDNTWRGENFGPASYINDLRNERIFLNYSGNTEANFGNGRDLWWFDGSDRNGIKRYYPNTPGFNQYLSARFNYWATLWGVNPFTEIHHYVATILNGRSPEIRPTCTGYFTMVDSQPVILDASYFGKAGSIVVSAKIPQVNPFSKIFGVNGGLYGAFNGLGNDLWAVSSARAGVKIDGLSVSNGAYYVQYPGYDTGWNLYEDDWDAVMIPVARAFNATNEFRWLDGRTSDDLLIEVRNDFSSKNPVRTSWTGGSNDYVLH